MEDVEKIARALRELGKIGLLFHFIYPHTPHC